jgi:uncharacterized protein YebE (UPF0316 family)
MSPPAFTPDFSGLLLPLSVFTAELCVVTIGTLRIIFVSRGMKFLAPVLGFFEVMTWLFAITQIMQNLSNPACFVAFAAGFAVGNFLGIQIERKLAMGSAVIRVITRQDSDALTGALRGANYGVTTLEGQGGTGPVRVVLTVVKRRELDRVVAIIKQHEPRAFYSIDELQSVAEGIFPARRGVLPGGPLNRLRGVGDPPE